MSRKDHHHMNTNDHHHDPMHGDTPPPDDLMDDVIGDIPTTPKDVEQALIHLFETNDEIPVRAADDDQGDVGMAEYLYVTEQMTFEQWGVMTTNAGVIIRTLDGAEFQVSIVQTRTGDDR